MRLSDPARLAVPSTDYRSYAEQGAGFLAGLLDHTALAYVDLPTGHWPMWSRPVELADVTPVSFMLFMSFLHRSATGVRGVLTGT